MMGVNAVMWAHMLNIEKNRLQQHQRNEEASHKENNAKQRGEEKGEVHTMIPGPSTSDVGLFFCQSHNLDFLDPLPTSEI